MNKPIIFVRLFIYWYGHQQFCISWAGLVSEFFSTTNGVRQGGITSPIFFNLYMDGLSKQLKESGLGCTLNGSAYNNFMYADDTCLLAPSPSGLQKLIDICSRYAIKHFILYNEKKTKCMCFLPRAMHRLYLPRVSLNTCDLLYVQCTRYLGFLICDSLSDNEDISRHIKFIYIKGNQITRKFYNCSTDVKVKLFNVFCVSIYGGHLWCNFTKARLNQAKIAYNKIFRYLFGLHGHISISMNMLVLGIDNFTVLLRKCIYNFRKRILLSCNPLIKMVTSSVFFEYSSSLNLLWRRQLF